MPNHPLHLLCGAIYELGLLEVGETNRIKCNQLRAGNTWKGWNTLDSFIRTHYMVMTQNMSKAWFTDVLGTLKLLHNGCLFSQSYGNFIGLDPCPMSNHEPLKSPYVKVQSFDFAQQHHRQCCEHAKKYLWASNHIQHPTETVSVPRRSHVISRKVWEPWSEIMKKSSNIFKHQWCHIKW